jgi:hypothetical protein
MRKLIQGLSFAIAATIAFSSSDVRAGTITPGSLIGAADADQLEFWLGVGDQDFTRIFTGAAGVATAAGFHAAADGAGATFTVYDIVLGDRTSALIGGYTTQDWGGPEGYVADAAAFIFNLTSGEAQFAQGTPQNEIYRSSIYFPIFGVGNDIFVGYGTLGTCDGATTTYCDGDSFSFSYDQAQGQITVAGDTGFGNGDSGLQSTHWSVRSMDVYTITPAVVPLPAGLPLLGGALACLMVLRRRARR